LNSSATLNLREVAKTGFRLTTTLVLIACAI
jgi:hypothetical protein